MYKLTVSTLVAESVSRRSKEYALSLVRVRASSIHGKIIVSSLLDRYVTVIFARGMGGIAVSGVARR